MMAEVQDGDGDGGMARGGNAWEVGAATMSSVLVGMLILILMVANQTLQRRRRRLPPGPWPWPVVGNFPQLSKAKDLPHRFLRALAAHYGGLMFLRLGMMTIMEPFEIKNEMGLVSDSFPNSTSLFNCQQ